MPAAKPVCCTPVDLRPTSHVDLIQHPRILPVARRDLHHHVILVERIVDGRHLALAERVVERVVDRAQGDAELHRRVAIDVDAV